MAAERLQKLLARAGVASRRNAEELITAGRVAVNGRVVTELGARADPAVDTISLDGRAVSLQAPGGALYYLLHKPVGYVCTTRDPAGRPSVLDLLPPTPGLVTVGRLDMETEGLLLLTTDGQWANRISHPRFGVEKEYRATVRGLPSFGSLRRLREGVDIPGGHTMPADVRLLRSDPVGGTADLALVLHEGRKRQVRYMTAAVGHPVVRLIRVRVGPLRLDGLAAGQYRLLQPSDIQTVAAGDLDGPEDLADSDEEE